MEIKVVKTASPKNKPDESKLGFGKIFTDHMFVMEHNAEQGWHNARIIPYGNLEISPASTVLHYGAEIFEGLKAYRLKDGSIQLFRPQENAKRMIDSAERLCLPEVPVEDFMTALKALIEIDKDWVPSAEGTAPPGRSSGCGGICPAWGCPWRRSPRPDWPGRCVPARWCPAC